MKKMLYLMIVIFLLSGCSDIEKSLIKNTNLEYFVSSDSISFTSNASYYTLYNDEEIIAEGNVEDNNIIDNLKSDTSYKLVVDQKEQVIKTDKVTIMRFGGDVMMTSYFKHYIDLNGIDYMWEDVSDLISSADYSIFNLETSVSLRGKDTKPEGYGFRSEPFTLKGLVNAGIDMVSVANNHVLDYGRDAFDDTINNLRNYEIEYIGAGKNLKDASKINYQMINGIKIAFIGTSEIIGYPQNKATEDESGVFYLDKNNLYYINDIIKEASLNSDYVVVVAHWDREYYNEPEEKTIEMAHSFVENGANIVIGHHPHVLQGIEYYQEGMIYYSTGNFNFLFMNENASQSALFEIGFDKEKIISSKIYPTKINACKANLLDDESKTYKEIINNLNERSKRFGTSINDDGTIFWK